MSWPLARPERSPHHGDVREWLRSSKPWVESAWGRRIADVRPLSGGWTSTVLRLTADDGEQAVLRLMTKEPWRRHAAGLLGREASVQRRLGGTAIPAPRSIAVDLAGIPAHLMSLLPGRLCLTSAGDDLLEELARLLVVIHRVPVDSGWPREYQSWAGPAKRVVPSWAEHPDAWEWAFALLERPAPGFDGVFLHRDFHLGNVLWAEGGVSGVVDWVEASWGPAQIDVAHAATYLAMLHGVEAAERFVTAYRRASGARLDDLGYWTVTDVVGYLPDPAKVAQPWRDCGVDIGDDLARVRLEKWLLNQTGSR